MSNFFSQPEKRGLSGGDLAVYVASFAVFDEVAGEGVYDFTGRTAAMCTLVYAVARTAGSA